MQIEISVVVPLYNKEKYIQRAIYSVLNQTVQNFECIIVDSSTDASTDLVNRFLDPRIIHITCEKSTAATARNFGVRKARSDFIAFLDADDEWNPEHLETLLNIRKKFPNAGLFSTPYIKLKPDGNPMMMLFIGIPPPPWEGYLSNYLRICSRGDEPVHSSSCAVPRDVFESMGGFPENLVYGEDQYLWGKISLQYPVAYSWNGLAIYHTEALGRICDEIHAIREHPFSEYLKHELASENIPPEKQRECRAYVRRKKYTQLFSSLIIQNKSEPCVEVSRQDEISRIQQTPENLFLWFLKKMSGIARNTYDSSVHDISRRILCKLYGCYNPTSIRTLNK